MTRLTNRERAMLLVALDNLICDYAKAAKRAKRRLMPATERACNNAVTRYRRLAARFTPNPPPRGRSDAS